MPQYIFVILLCFVCAAVEIKSTVKLVRKYKESSRMLKQAQSGGVAVIRCKNAAYQQSAPIIAICCNLGGCAVMLYILLRFFRVFVTWKWAFWILIVYFIFFAADSILKTVLNIWAIKREPFAYLTEDGMLCFWEVYRFGANRFSWEAGENSDTLHIYQPNKNEPLTFVFPEQQAEAHRIVSAHSTNN